MSFDGFSPNSSEAPVPVVATTVAEILDVAGVPNILWGYAALGLVGQIKNSTVSK